MHEMMKQKVSSYSMKMRLYPSGQQRDSIDKILRALHIAYNLTFHQVFLMNPAVCSEPNKDGACWPDYRKMAKKEWRAYLIAQNPAVEDAPAASLTTNNGLFRTDAKRAWETGMHNLPIDPERRKDFHFYHSGKPRRSFYVQMESKNLILSAENEKVAWVTVPKVGRIKARGFNPRLRFGDQGKHSFAEAQQAGELPKSLSIRVSKDTCGDYFVSITFTEAKDNRYNLHLETPVVSDKVPIGVDAGIKDIAILNTGQKIENKHFKQKKQKTLSTLNRELSRRWGPANMAYRDYSHHLRQEKRRTPDADVPLAKPSNRYLKSQATKALIERKIARQRNTYYHQQTAALVRQSNLIAMETLLVTNMMRNHKQARALADAAMSDFLAKLRYKAERYQIPVCCIGMFEPTSQLCSSCGTKDERLKDLGIRYWTCQHCGAKHDRDVNAARNILKIAIEKGGIQDKQVKEAPAEKPPPGKRRVGKQTAFLPDMPDVAVVYSKELTRLNDPRYVIKNTKTNTILDDAQGAGYRSAANARNCYKAKIRWSRASSE